jgi:hypothetical protein
MRRLPVRITPSPSEIVNEIPGSAQTPRRFANFPKKELISVTASLPTCDHRLEYGDSLPPRKSLAGPATFDAAFSRRRKSFPPAVDRC